MALLNINVAEGIFFAILITSDPEFASRQALRRKLHLLILIEYLIARLVECYFFLKDLAVKRRSVMVSQLWFFLITEIVAILFSDVSLQLLLTLEILDIPIITNDDLISFLRAIVVG